MRNSGTNLLSKRDGGETKEQSVERKQSGGDGGFSFANLDGKMSEDLVSVDTASGVEALESMVSESEVEENSERAQLLWKLVVGGICFLWGTNFATIRQIFNEVPYLDPAVYASLRFGIAAVVFLPSYIGRLGDVKLVRNSFLCGLFVFTGYIGQAIGLLTGAPREVGVHCELVRGLGAHFAVYDQQVGVSKSGGAFLLSLELPFGTGRHIAPERG